MSSSTLNGIEPILASILSQTRSSIIGLIVALVIFFIFSKNKENKSKLGMTFLIISIFLCIFIPYTNLSNRIIDGYQEFTSPLEQVANTSVGERRQLWFAAWQLSKISPLTGIGKNQFNTKLQGDFNLGIISPTVKTYSHPHNELLFALVETGIFGFFGVLSLYLGPLYFFWKNSSHASKDIQQISILGMMIVVVYFVSGFFDVVINALVMQAPIYAIMVIIPYGLITSLKLELSR